MDDSGENAPRAIKHFELLRRLQIDGEYHHWLARDPTAGTTVELSLEPAHSISSAATSIRTESNLRPLGCPEILPILERGTFGNEVYCAVPHVAHGIPLNQFCRPDSLLPESTVVALFARLAIVLDEFHRRHGAHGCITPASILVRSSASRGSNRKSIDDFLRLRLCNGGINPKPYRPPEFKDQPEPNLANDMYAFAAVLFEVVAGRLPNSQRLPVKSQEHLKWPPLHAFRNNVSPVLERVLSKSLAPKAKSRYRSLVELAGDLDLVAETTFESDIGVSRNGMFIAARSLECFGNLADSELWEIVNPSRWLTYEADVNIQSQSGASEHLYAIVCGSVAQFENGHLTANLGPGTCFGTQYLVKELQLPAAVTYYASAGTTLLAVPAVAVEQMTVSCQLGLHHQLLQQVSHRLRRITARAALPAG